MSSTFAQFSSNVNDSIVITIEKLNSSVNSNFDDYAPIISANEEELYFTSKRPQTEKEIKKEDKTKDICSYLIQCFMWIKNKKRGEL
jgi:hypothetical protein